MSAQIFEFIALLHGSAYEPDDEESSCAFWLIDSPELAHLRGRVTGGFLRFHALNESLWTCVEYSVAGTLSPPEIAELTEYTLGQLSDGIGENATGDWQREVGIEISLAGFTNPTVRVEIEGE